jgi:hypothetical protein
MSGLNNRIRSPFGKAETLSLSYAATINIAPWNSETVITIGQLTGAATINAAIDAEMQTGANLTLKMSADSNSGGRVVTLGTGFTGNAITVPASKSVVAEFKYDGSKLLHIGTTTVN